MSEVMEPRAPSDIFDLPVQTAPAPEAPPVRNESVPLRAVPVAMVVAAAGLVVQFPLWLSLAFAAVATAGLLLTRWRYLRRLVWLVAAAAFGAKATKVVLPQFSLRAHFVFFVVMLGVIVVFWGLLTDDL